MFVINSVFNSYYIYSILRSLFINSVVTEYVYLNATVSKTSLENCTVTKILEK